MTSEVFFSFIYIFWTAVFAMNYYSWVHRNDSKNDLENNRYGVMEMIIYMIFWPYYLVKLILNIYNGKL